MQQITTNTISSSGKEAPLRQFDVYLEGFSDEELARPSRYLKFFCSFLIAIVLPVSVLALVGYLYTNTGTLLAVSGIALVLGIIGGIVLFLLRRNQPVTGVVLLFGTLQFVTMFIAVAMPLLQPIVMLSTLMSVAIILPFINLARLRQMMMLAWLICVIAVVIIQVEPFGVLIPPPPKWIAGSIFLIVLPLAIGLTFQILWLFSQHLNILLIESRRSNNTLLQYQAELEQRVSARTSELRSALDQVAAQAAAQAELLRDNEKQREIIRELSVPVLPISSSTLVMPLIGELDSVRLQMMRERALQALEHSRAQVLVLDITGVPIVDSFVAQGLLSVVQAGRLLGARVVLVGIRPEVAQTIVALQLPFSELTTFKDLESAIQTLN
jgi:rsbT co-antagonist protein RsbR